MKSDIILEGKNAAILKELVEKNYYNNYAEAFFDSLLLGLIEGKKGDLSIGSEEVKISRTWIANSKRDEFKNLINIYVNLEMYSNGKPLTIKEIFLDEEGTDSSSKMQEIKEYAYHGITVLSKKFLEGNNFFHDYEYYEFILDNLKEKDEIEFEKNNEVNNDEQIDEIINDLI